MRPWPGWSRVPRTEPPAAPMISRIRSRSLRCTSRGSQTTTTPSTRSISATASAYDSTGGASTMTTAPGRSASATMRLTGAEVRARGTLSTRRPAIRVKAPEPGTSTLVRLSDGQVRSSPSAAHRGRPCTAEPRSRASAGVRRSASTRSTSRPISAKAAARLTRCGGSRGVVAARGGDQEPAALLERRVVGEPERHRPVLLGQSAAAAADGEQRAGGATLPGEGAQQRGAERADQFAGGADGRVEDEAHPGQQQTERESDDAAEPEQQGQSRPGGLLRRDGLLVEVAGRSVESAQLRYFPAQFGDRDDQIGPGAGHVVTAGAGRFGQLVALLGERLQLGTVAGDHVVDAVLGALLANLQVGVGERLGPPFGQRGVRPV